MYMYTCIDKHIYIYFSFCPARSLALALALVLSLSYTCRTAGECFATHARSNCSGTGLALKYLQ